MQSFLEEIADYILTDKHSMENLVLVVPSRRAKRYLSKALSEKITTAVFSPKMYSIEDFVQELSGLQPIKAAALQFQFYEVYSQTVAAKQQSFEQFLHWAPVLLKDFNDLDAHLAPVVEVFDYMTSLERIKSWAQEEETRTTVIANYLEFWKQAPALYHALYSTLLAQQMGYLGMLFREAVANLEFYLDQSKQHHYFIGFNALSKAEAFLIQEILDAKKGECFWDIDRILYEDPHHQAGKFIRSYFKNWKHLRPQKAPQLHDHFTAPKTIYCIASSGRIAQAKYAAQCAVAQYTKHPHQQIAIVLSDESLLVPVLSGFPEGFTDYNISMGYALSQAPQTGFFRELLRLHLNSTTDGFLFSDLRMLLHTPKTKALFRALLPNWKAYYKKLEQQNRAVVSRQELLHLEKDHSLLQLLFGRFESAAALLPRFQSLCEIFYKHLSSLKGQNTAWEVYCLQRFIALFEQLASFTSTVQGIEQVAVLQQLIEEQLALETVDFSGSPIRGIQILGVLETRLLDFDTVIMTDVNEGVLPAGKKQQSFLPFEVKKNYELPTFLEQDAIYTYHFYRLLHRASSCHLLYNSSASGLQTGEPSRFLAQLELLPQAHHKIEHKVLHNSSNLKLSATQEFPKTSGVVQRLSAWAQKGISPSALTSYLRDPLQFYERYVLQLKAPPTWSLVMHPRESGTLLHDVLETLYAPYRNGVLTEAQLVKMEANFEGLLLEQYRKFHSGNPNRHGKNHLIFEALKAYGKALLAYEKKQINAGHELKIIALEQEVSLSIKLASGALVRLKGIIDRIDYFDGQLRIIDYKTGKIEGADLKIKQWDTFLDTTSAAAFQLLTYALMYAQQQPTLTAGIYALQSTHKTFFPLFVPEQTSAKISQQLSAPSLKQFELQLLHLLEEIMNTAHPFAASKN